jgi:hypothetical protein
LVCKIYQTPLRFLYFPICWIFGSCIHGLSQSLPRSRCACFPLIRIQDY